MERNRSKLTYVNPIMARINKALKQNKKGKGHRDHRAKKTRDNYPKDGSPVYFKKKKGY
ncbi:MAG TPA: hypothetical protein VMZ04_00870 [Anaerolineae bacterium]|nr:hypothetical protein [Anaerolineae bacterium]